MSQGHDRINQAVSQGFDAGKLKTYYDGWAQTYDADVLGQQYQAPKLSCDTLAKHCPPSEDKMVLDIGCGTGLVGPELKKAGFEKIDGFDLSPEMVDEAKKTGAYQEGGLWGGVDMTKSYELGGRKYDAAISVGVFTTGHVKPDSLQFVLPHMKSGAVIVFTAREAYVAEHGLDAYLEEMASKGTIKQISVERELPYHDLSKASYYTIEVV